MSNTKQQIEEMISDFGEDSISYGEELHTGRVKSDDEIKSDSVELLRKQTEIVEAIDRLVIEARKPYIKMLKLYGTPTCDSLHHPKGYYHSALESCPVADRIPKSTIKALIEAAKMLNLELHGREDCKNCALMEQLEEML